jgi:hypothetical protein
LGLDCRFCENVVWVGDVGKGLKRENCGDVANAQTTDAYRGEPVILTPFNGKRKSYVEAAKKHLPRLRVRFGSVMSRIAEPLTLTK